MFIWQVKHHRLLVYLLVSKLQEQSRCIFPTWAQSLCLCVCVTWVVWLDLFVYKWMFAVYVTSIILICPFTERICGMVEITWHGKETCRLTSISIQIEGKKKHSSVLLTSAPTTANVGLRFCAPLLAQWDTRERSWGLGDKWSLSDLDALWCMIPSRTKSSETMPAVNIKRGMSLTSLSLVYDVYFTGRCRVRISSFCHHLVENHRYPRAPLAVENFSALFVLIICPHQ